MINLTIINQAFINYLIFEINYFQTTDFDYKYLRVLYAKFH